MLYTVHWADSFGSTAKQFTTFLDALDWIYMLASQAIPCYLCCEELN